VFFLAYVYVLFVVSFGVAQCVVLVVVRRVVFGGVECVGLAYKK